MREAQHAGKKYEKLVYNIPQGFLYCRFGPSWHVVVGEGFGFEVSYELKNLMYMFFAGNLAVCAWKCS